MNKLLVGIVALTLAGAAAAEPYRKPSQAILDVLHAPPAPSAAVSPTRDRLMLATLVRNPPIAYLSQPMLRLAGVRITPRNNGLHGAPYWTDFTLARIADGSQIKVKLPRGSRLGQPHWSADGKHYAFTNIQPEGVELWVGDTNGQAHRVDKVRLNPVLDDELQWMPDQRSLLVKLALSGRAAPSSDVPEGPKTQQASGTKGRSSTYEARDVLKNPNDAALFQHYATSQLARVDVTSGAVTPLGKPALYTNLAPAPDGQHLLVESIHPPFSYQTGYERFPHDIEIWDSQGKRLHQVASLPLADAVPVWGVRTGPREFRWRPTQKATLVWAEALDGGDWDKKVPHRDRLLALAAPFQGTPVEICKTEQRFSGLRWTEKGGQAVLSEYDAIRHRAKTSLIDADHPQAPPKVLWERSSDDAYKDPGTMLGRLLPNGFGVLLQDGDAVFLSGNGASPEGDRPFLDRFDLVTQKTVRLFHSDKDAYESFVCWTDLPHGQFLTRRETPTSPPNYYVRTLESSTLRALTHMADPTPVLRGITKRIVKYQRADGVNLSFTLYLPPGYKEGTRLPTVVWAYPLDYADPQVAGQVVGSTSRFTTLGWPLHLFFLLDGYAIIDNPSMPVIGETNKIYDTYMEQLLAGAKAAVDKAVELGVTDPERIGVTGHSHGGLMTVNLLAHSKLFRAGIARSGAYNRSLTAFGFQNERRSLWQAQDVYLKVSPFFSADKIKEPLLLIHGDSDFNPGTVPLQSEQLYEAVRGNGGTVRLVMLPCESHGYRAMESTEHVLWEMLDWFDRYVKHSPAIK